MWVSKHRDLKTQRKHRIKMTAAELAAVRIIETWYNKKRNIASSKPEAKKNVPIEMDMFKEATRSLAQARASKNHAVK